MFLGARTVYGKVFIGDTSLRNYITKYIKPMIYRNSIKCGHKTCISVMLLQSDLNKFRLSQLVKLDRLYIIYSWTILLQRSKYGFIENKNQIILNN